MDSLSIESKLRSINDGNPPFGLREMNTNRQIILGVMFACAFRKTYLNSLRFNGVQPPLRIGLTISEHLLQHCV